MSFLAFDSLDYLVGTCPLGFGNILATFANSPVKPSVTRSSYFCLEHDTWYFFLSCPICQMPGAVGGVHITEMVE